MTAEVVARYFSGNRVHELVRDVFRGRTMYTIQTRLGGNVIAMRTVTDDEACEWVEMCRKGGGDE